MIRSLSVTNFKSWQRVENMRLAPFTGLFGTNSSGKTSLLQLLLLMKQTVQSTDRAQVLNLGDEKSLVTLGTFRDVLYGHEKGESVDFGFSWSLPRGLLILAPQRKKSVLFSGKWMRFSTRIGENGSGRMIVHELRYRFQKHDFILKRKSDGGDKYSLSALPTDFKFKRTVGRAWPLPPPVKCYGFPDQMRAYYQNAGFLADFALALEELFSRLYYLGPLREYPKREYTWAGAQPADMGQRGEKVVDALLASRDRGERISRGKGKPRLTVEEYAAWWLRELRLIHDFSVKPITEKSNLYRVWVRTTPRAAEVLITDVGFGVAQVLPVIVLCYYVPEGSVVVLEQPEIHLHPLVQAGLADVFIDAIKRRNIQILLESHSEHLPRRLQRRVAEKRLSKDETALYFCDVSRGRSRLQTLDLDLFGNITNWPPNFFGYDFGEIAAMARAAATRQRQAQP